MNYDDYLQIRHVEKNIHPKMPKYLKQILPADKNARLLDIGCGYGNLLYGMREAGYKNIQGIDMDGEAVAWVNSQSVLCSHMDVRDFYPEEKFDFVTMSHVLEHMPKDQIIDTLRHIRTNILNSSGGIAIMVPNGQAYMGCYWAYEDFTHNFLFTAGSLEYVLKCAGFSKITVLDPYGTSNNHNRTWRVIRIPHNFHPKPFPIGIHLYQYLPHKPNQNWITWEVKVVAEIGE